jgi:hypothetical protein
VEKYQVFLLRDTTSHGKLPSFICGVMDMWGYDVLGCVSAIY